jgi:hypothetical protein
MRALQFGAGRHKVLLKVAPNGARYVVIVLEKKVYALKVIPLKQTQGKNVQTKEVLLPPEIQEIMGGVLV